MSCENCESVQEGLTDDGAAYVRIGNGNVQIAGCRKHLQELLEKLRVAGPGKSKGETK